MYIHYSCSKFYCFILSNPITFKQKRKDLLNILGSLNFNFHILKAVYFIKIPLAFRIKGVKYESPGFFHCFRTVCENQCRYSNATWRNSSPDCAWNQAEWETNLCGKHKGNNNHVGEIKLAKGFKFRHSFLLPTALWRAFWRWSQWKTLLKANFL